MHRFNRSIATEFSAIHKEINCPDSCRFAKIRKSFPLENKASSKCFKKAPSVKDKFCICFEISRDDSSIIAFITKPAPFTIVIEE